MNLAASLLGNKVNNTNLQDFLQQMFFFPKEYKTYWNIPRGRLTSLGMDKLIPILFLFLFYIENYNLLSFR